MNDALISLAASNLLKSAPIVPSQVLPNDPIHMAASGNPPNQVKVPAKQFMANYMQSQIYKQRLASMGINTVPSPNRILDANVTTDWQRSTAYRKEPHWYSSKDEVNINLPEIKHVSDFYPGTKEAVDAAMAHELSHGARKLNDKEMTLIASLNDGKDGSRIYKEYQNLKKAGAFTDYNGFLGYKGGTTDKEILHDEKPNENKADLDAFRFLMKKNGIYDTSKRPMTMDDFEKAKAHPEIKNDLIFRRLIERFKPSDIINLNNTIASNAPKEYVANKLT
jgi:hypothetical protein